MTLPKRIRDKEAERASWQKPNRTGRFKSMKHRDYVRTFACSIADCNEKPIEVAHVRIGSGAGMGQKPDDWRVVSLCRKHHDEQHRVGERTFWEGFDIEALIKAFCDSSPAKREIEQAKRERGL